MISHDCPTLAPNFQQLAHQYLLQGKYTQAAALYEQAIATEPDIKQHYWNLGLILLLQGQEVEAQTAWLLGMAEGDSADQDKWVEELLKILHVEAERRQVELKDYATAWVVRQHIRNIDPTDINNLLHLVGLSTLLETYTSEELVELGIIDLLKSGQKKANPELLISVLKNILDRELFHQSTFDLAEACLPYVEDPISFINTLIEVVHKIFYSAGDFQLAIRFSELGLKLDANNRALMCNLPHFYQDISEFEKGIEAAKKYFELVETTVDKIYANLLVMRGLMSAGGYWDEFCSAIDLQKSLLRALLDDLPRDLSPHDVIYLFNATFFFPYFQDRPVENGQLRSQVSQLCQLNVENYSQERVEHYRRHQLRPIRSDRNLTRKLKIGYLSHCLRCHSVGWLARGVFENYDRERFEVNTYLVSAEHREDPLQEWYISQSSKSHKCGINGQEIANKIDEDEIDILVDLDSLTMTNSCEIMAMKPAPIQVTWLGWDASGIPAIDYFLADPYVVSESAQEYYSEKIWRLPQTYIAVDGFEVSSPTLRRDRLNICNDAVIYYSGQRGFKYNPHTVRLQMQILKAVPQGYLLLKSHAHQESIQKLFIEIAESEGVSSDRLIFLPLAGTEAIHRANLGIVDVALDTYPYNGATTTMETLWMGVPLVTLVGEQFAARNSYTMMRNVGLIEGVAWTPDEYVEWGIRLGTDVNLRQQVTWKLRQSRHTSPLWNAKQFTRHLEQAYEQMWQLYRESQF